MEVSKVVLSDEFKEKTKSKLSKKQIGELRYKKLREIEKEGRLQFAKSRVEVARMIGINDYKKGTSWATYLIKKNLMTETHRGIENGKTVYEYHTNEKPKAEHTTPVILSRAYEPKAETGMVVTITQKDMTIKIENVTTDSLIKLAKTMKGDM